MKTNKRLEILLKNGNHRVKCNLFDEMIENKDYKMAKKYLNKISGEFEDYNFYRQKIRLYEMEFYKK